MITVILCSVLFYSLGLVAPTSAALHACIKQKTLPNENAMLLWTQYFLLFSALVTVVFPYVVTPLFFLLPSWLLAMVKLVLVVALAVPKLGLTSRFYGWFLCHYVEYLDLIAKALQQHVVIPLKTYVSDAIARMQASTEASVSTRKEL
ncbi:putative transmembrane protein [Toxoplasma gondii TgCatPRC2]|uniref:Transmembrane protein n=14 Tax=Toxoplasma gondii TaxID=5811 RepID=A0A125YZ87_TOXGG|nr:hypothetical protein TGME49_216180 [Toxoplasma gondii ME49]EPR58651.1 hypothetical protein TGGT1_216180 [Toxoplasma gondii GT1]ESS28730.1 putative transmembrane protein [Toxoplasma gondii VEG]KAF4639867.1 hypothetical protein TGRH88_056390 [Toxoplasma gondii]KFG30269.1 putative transmembrane protein [Toxoplasma gondii GAB2-2007-GAL-DOM2]KFG31739.1 putative transmembrane protein [Toxoplasma gondii p89]KFG40844.1 putative transmembrane protein [Toxoplasma gondii FOU]KFG58371.1 putative tran|eukprot:XP_002370928.1 hypothetical protein TGME49_216180 [Toxoplasma gondii ME49]